MFTSETVAYKPPHTTYCTIFDCKIRSLLYVYGTVLYIITPEGNCTYMPQIGMNNVPNIVVRGGVDVCWQVSSSNNSSSSPLLPLSPTPHPLLLHTHTHTSPKGDGNLCNYFFYVDSYNVFN